MNYFIYLILVLISHVVSAQTECPLLTEERLTTNNQHFNDITFERNKFFLHDRINDEILTSPNGGHWQFIELNKEIVILENIAFGSDKVLLIARNPYTEKYTTFLTQKNFIHWKQYTLQGDLRDNLQRVAYIDNKFFAFGKGAHNSFSLSTYINEPIRKTYSSFLFQYGTRRFPLWFSQDGIHWEHTTQQFQSISHINKIDDTYYLLTSIGIVYISKDGLKWDYITDIKPFSYMSAMTSNNNSTIVIVGYYGLLVVSLDNGKSWSRIKLDMETNLYDIVWTGKEFIIAGDCSTILRSEDGEHWEQALIKSDSIVRLVKIATNGKTHIAVGAQMNLLCEKLTPKRNYHAAMVISHDGKNWQSKSLLDLYKKRYTNTIYDDIGVDIDRPPSILQFLSKICPLDSIQ